MKFVNLDYAPEYERRRRLTFGITEITAALVAGGLEAGGLGALTGAAPFLAGGLEGAALGAATSGLTGGDPLKGALTGGLTGGAIGGIGPLVSSATGLGTAASDALVGAGAGAAGSAITGQSPLTGAIGGGAAGLAAGLSGPTAAPSSQSATVTPAGPSTGAVTPAGTGGSLGAQSAAAASPISLDPTSGATGAPGGTVQGGTNVAQQNPFDPGGFGGTGSGTQPAVNFGPDPTMGAGEAAGGGDFSSSGGGVVDSVVNGLKSNPGLLLSGGMLASQLFRVTSNTPPRSPSTPWQPMPERRGRRSAHTSIPGLFPLVRIKR